MYREADLEKGDRKRGQSITLRAPLISIKGSTATALGASPAPHRTELLQIFRIIDGQADHMRGLIANLLDASSIEAGTLTVAPEATSIASLVESARNTFLTGGGRHAVVVDLPPDLPPAMVDPQRIGQVLNNLLANAARHSPPSAPIPRRGRNRGHPHRPVGL